MGAEDACCYEAGGEVDAGLDAMWHVSSMSLARAVGSLSIMYRHQFYCTGIYRYHLQTPITA